MSRLLVTVFAVGLFAISPACSSKKDKDKTRKKGNAPAAAQCKTDKDCGGPPNLCVQGKCASPSSKGVMKNPGALNPAAMKKEVQKRADERQKKLDRSLDMDK